MKLKARTMALALMLAGTTHGSLALAVSEDQVPQPKRTTLHLYLTSPQAYEVAQKERVLFLDVRTRSEVNFLGMPTVADANIPYMEMNDWHYWDDKKRTFKLDLNSGFVAEVEKRLADKGMAGRDAKIIVLCRSGDRSAKAADLLAKSGFTNVYSVIDGYEGDIAKDGPKKGQRAVNGWRNNDLPWSYELAKEKMYLE